MTSARRSRSSGGDEGSVEPSNSSPDGLSLKRQYTDLLHHVRTAVVSHLEADPGEVTLLQRPGKDEMELHVYHHHHISLDKPPGEARVSDQPSLLKKRKDYEEVANKTLLDILWSKNQPFYNSGLNSVKQSPQRNKKREGAPEPLRQESAASPLESSKGSKIREPARISPNSHKDKPRGSFSQNYSSAGKKPGTGDKEQPSGKSKIQSLEEAAQQRIRKLSNLGSLISPTDGGVTDDSELAETRWEKEARIRSIPKQGSFEEETQAAQESFLAAARAAKERLRSLINECANSNAGCDAEAEDCREQALEKIERCISEQDTGESEPNQFGKVASWSSPSEMRSFSPSSVVSSDQASSSQYGSDVSTTYPSQEVRPTYEPMEDVIEELEDMTCLDNISIEDILRKRQTPTPSKERNGDYSDVRGHLTPSSEQRGYRPSYENPAQMRKRDKHDGSPSQNKHSSPKDEWLHPTQKEVNQTRSPKEEAPQQQYWSPKQELMHQQQQELLQSPKQEYVRQAGLEHAYPQHRTPQQPNTSPGFVRPPRPSPRQEVLQQSSTGYCSPSQDLLQQQPAQQRSLQRPSPQQSSQHHQAFMARDLSSLEELGNHPLKQLTPQRRSLEQWGWKHPGKLGSDIEEDFHLSSAAEYKRVFAGGASRAAGEHTSATQEHISGSALGYAGQEHAAPEHNAQRPRDQRLQKHPPPTANTMLAEAAGSSVREPAVCELRSQSNSSRVEPEVAKLISGLALNSIEEALANLDKKLVNVTNLRHEVVDGLTSGHDSRQPDDLDAAVEKRAQPSCGKDKDLESLKQVKKRLKQELQQIWDKNGEAPARIKVKESEFEKLTQANKMLQMELDKLQGKRISDIKKQDLLQKFNTVLNEAENLRFSLNTTREAIVKEEEKNGLLRDRFGDEGNLHGREQAILNSAKQLNTEMIEKLSRMEDAVSNFSTSTKNLLPFLEEHLAITKCLASPERDEISRRVTPTKAHQGQALETQGKPVLSRDEQNNQLEAFKRAAELKRQQINELVGLNQEVSFGSQQKEDERPRDESSEKSQTYRQTKEMVQIMDTLQHHYNVLKTKYTEMEGEMVRRQRLAAGEDNGAVKKAGRSSRNSKQEMKGRVERLERMKKELQGRLRLLEDEIRASSQQIQDLKGQSVVMKGLMSSKEDEADAIRREAKEVSQRVMQLEQELLEKEGEVSVLPTSLSSSDDSV